MGPRTRAVHSEVPQRPRSSLLHVDRRRCEKRDERWHGTGGGDRDRVRGCAAHTASRHDATRPSCPRARAVHSEVPQRPRSSLLNADRRRCEPSDERWHGTGSGYRVLVRLCGAHTVALSCATNVRPDRRARVPFTARFMRALAAARCTSTDGDASSAMSGGTAPAAAIVILFASVVYTQ